MLLYLSEIAGLFSLQIIECMSSNTVARFIADEKRDTIKDAIIHQALELRPLNGPIAIIQVDLVRCFIGLLGYVTVKIPNFLGNLSDRKSKSSFAENAMRKIAEEFYDSNQKEV